MNAQIFNLSDKKVSKSTLNELNVFVYENCKSFGQEQKLFYSNVRSILERELTKKAANRLSMDQILERAYNIEQHILASGAVSVTTEFVTI
jgi:hypothetical protein